MVKRIKREPLRTSPTQSPVRGKGETRLDEVAVADGRTIAVGLFGLVVVVGGTTGIGLAVGVAGVAEQAAWVINATSISA